MQFLRRLEWTETAYLFFFKNDPVEKELKVLICIIYAKLFKAVEGKILQSTKVRFSRMQSKFYRNEEY